METSSTSSGDALVFFPFGGRVKAVQPKSHSMRGSPRLSVPEVSEYLNAWQVSMLLAVQGKTLHKNAELARLHRMWKTHRHRSANSSTCQLSKFQGSFATTRNATYSHTPPANDNGARAQLISNHSGKINHTESSTSSIGTKNVATPQAATKVSTLTSSTVHGTFSLNLDDSSEVDGESRVLSSPQLTRAQSAVTVRQRGNSAGAVTARALLPTHSHILFSSSQAEKIRQNRLNDDPWHTPMQESIHSRENGENTAVRKKFRVMRVPSRAMYTQTLNSNDFDLTGAHHVTVSSRQIR